MIRFFIFFLLALGIGSFLSIKLAEDPGYVLISFQGYSLEATLVTLLLSILIIFVLMFGLLWLLKIVNPLKLLKKDTWLYLFSRSNPRKASEQGLQLLLLGHWQEAYKLLVTNAERVPSPAFNYLAASLAAFQRKDRLSFSYCLDQAERSSSGAISGIKNLKALLELKSGQIEQSLAILLALKKEVPDSPYVLTLIKDIYISVSDWEKLEQILPELRKYKVLDEQSLHNLTENITLYKLDQAGTSPEGAEAVKRIWHAAAKPIRSSEKVTAAYLRKLLQFGNDAEALALLTRSLKQHWSDSLVELLGRIDSDASDQQLLLLEGWIKSRPNNVVLMLTLGRVSMRTQRWGKAKEYFDTALRFSKDRQMSAEINGELARLLQHLGEHERSLACYNKAMGLLEKKLPDLPMPEKASIE